MILRSLPPVGRWHTLTGPGADMNSIVKMRSKTVAVLLLTLALSALAHAQPGATSKPARTLTEQEIKELLVWNSPWENKSIYSFRTTFVLRRNELIAQVMRY